MAACTTTHAAWITKLLSRDTISILGELKLGEDKDFAALLDNKVTKVSIGLMVGGNEPWPCRLGG